MDGPFTNVGDFRGKGSKKSRLGPRMRMDVGARRGNRQLQTPDAIALGKLMKALQARQISHQDRLIYRNIMASAEQLRFMNMAVLAEVLVYLNSVKMQPTTVNFTYNILKPYIDRLLPHKDTTEYANLSPNDLDIMSLRFAATFYRYIHYFNVIKTTRDAKLNEALERRGDQSEYDYQ